MKKKLPVYLLFAGLFVYLILRGIFVQPIHDSIATFFRYVHIGEIFPYHSEWSANNHYLNSLLTFISYKFFGSSPLALKLPNILLFPVYFYFVYKISLEIENKMLRWGFLIVLTMTHNFFEFFAVSRGYGMSMALLSGGLWFTIQAFKKNSLSHYVYALLFMIPACYANLTIMNSFIIISGLLILNAAINGPDKIYLRVKKLLVVVLLGIIPIFLGIILLLKLKAQGELYYGKPDGFFEVTVKSLLQLLTNSDSQIYVWIAVGYFFTVCAGFIFIILKKLSETKNFRSLIRHEWLFFYLLAGNMIASFLENKFFGTNYPEDRTGLYFFPYLTGSIFFISDKLPLKQSFIKWLMVIPLAFFPIQFLSNVNLTRSSLEDEAIPERFHDKVAAATQPGKIPPTIEGYRSRIFRWVYMNFRKDEELSLIQYNTYPSLDGDYQLVKRSEYPLWQHYYDSVDFDKHTGLWLLKRKHKLEKKLIYHKEGITMDSASNAEYFEFAKGPIDSLAGKTLYCHYNLRLISDQKPFHGWIVTTVFDKDRNVLRYEYIPFDWYRTIWNDGRPFINGMLVHEIPSDAATYVTYIWNIKKIPFIVKQCDFSMFSLEKDY